MATAIKKTPSTNGVYRFVYDIEAAAFSTADWEIDPDISGVASVPQRYWKYDGTSVVAEMSQGEKDTVDGFLLDQDNPVVAGTIGFEKNGWCRNKWLGFGIGKPSNVTPYVIPCPMNVTALTFVNNNNSVETDVEVYKNGVKIYTWEVRDSRWAWKTQGTRELIFEPGDRIGVFLRDRGTDPRNCIVTLHYTTWNHIVGEGSGSTL